MNSPQPGDRISNYLLEEVIGSGSFGQVWRAKHHVLDQTVAIKILTDPQYVRNFRTEGVVVHGIRHPNVVRAMDLDPYADPPYLIMEFVDGPALRTVIDQYPDGLPIDTTVRITRGILTGLQAAHNAGLIHRDVKPANILLRLPNGNLDQVEEGDVKLTDFGLGSTTTSTTTSIMQSGSLNTEDGQSIAGTLAYMSPEHKVGQQVDPRSDLYSCAIVIFEMLTGSRPEGSDLPSMVRPEVPPYIDELFRQMYTRLDRRLPSAEAALATINQRPSQQKPQKNLYPPIEDRLILTCTSCGANVDGNDSFCISCGHQLVDTVPRCFKCRAFVNRNDRFCIFCGQQLIEDADA